MNIICDMVSRLKKKEIIHYLHNIYTAYCGYILTSLIYCVSVYVFICVVYSKQTTQISLDSFSQKTIIVSQRKIKLEMKDTNVTYSDT